MADEWLKASYDDLLVIENIIEVEYLTHIVAFHSQQSVEKALKAVFEAKKLSIPKIHKLQTLKQKIDFDFEFLDDIVLDKLDELYIESRCPADMGLLPYGKPTLDDAKEFYEFALKVFDNICDMLKIDKNDLRK